MLDRLVSQKTKLNVYFTLNFIVALMALFVSWRAFLFFSVYIFLIWFYSHKIKKQPFIGNLMSAFLAVLPFFAILLYYYNQIPFEAIENYSNQLAVIFAHASFLFLLLLIREMIKDLENLKGDLANDYKMLVGNVFNFETIFRDNNWNYEMDDNFQFKHQTIIAKYREIYNSNLNKWKQSLASLNEIIKKKHF